MTAAGYAGNPRYLVAAAALGAALAGVAVRRRRGRRRRRSRRRARGAPLGRARCPSAPRLVAAVLATTAGTLRDQFAELAARAERRRRVRRRDRRAGGRDALVRCARDPHEHPRALVRRLAARPADARPRRRARAPRAWSSAPGGSTAAASSRRAAGYRTLATRPYWQIVAACGRALDWLKGRPFILAGVTEVAIVVHGGRRAPGRRTRTTARSTGVERAVAAGHAVLAAGGDALDGGRRRRSSCSRTIRCSTPAAARCSTSAGSCCSTRR